jgi:hypothetical protein
MRCCNRQRFRRCGVGACSEEVAFYNGNDRERDTINTVFADLVRKTAIQCFYQVMSY